MNPNKDYYKILGVLDDAEDIVIKAAYRALAQKYHPDKNQTKAAKDRMQEINEAYAILSNPNERKKYDGSRKKREYETDNSNDTKDLLKSLEKDWKDALEYFPDLEDLAYELAKYSKQLEYTFKVLVIDSKEFKNRFDLSRRLKKQYITKYFGTNRDIQEFAEELFDCGDIASLKKLNKAVNLLGSDVDSEIIINKISNKRKGAARKYQESQEQPNLINNAKILTSKNYQGDYFIERTAAIDFLRGIGAQVLMAGFWTERYLVVFAGEEKEFTPDGLIAFARKEAVAFLKRTK